MQKVLAKMLKVCTLRFNFLPKDNNFLLKSSIFKHACKTPMTTLLCSLESLAQNKNSRHLPEDEISNVTMLNIGLIAAKRISEMIKLLDEDSNAERTGEVFGVSSAIHELITICQNASQDRRVSLHDESGQLQLKGSKILFQEAITCILNNAFESYQEDSSWKLVVVYLRHQNEKFQVEVVDFGRGMSRLTTKAASITGLSYKLGGSGLGMSFARNTITQKFAGRLDIESKLGMGTRVLVTIPS
jgi:sensor histidine kinase regulating citrate/malate metabolism